jgi:hypothetical protein
VSVTDLIPALNGIGSSDATLFRIVYSPTSIESSFLGRRKRFTDCPALFRPSSSSTPADDAGTDADPRCEGKEGLGWLPLGCPVRTTV